MTETTTDQVAQDPEEFYLETFMAREWDGRRIDWFLQKLVSMANDSGLEFGVTLTVGSGMVTGTLISAEKYFAAFGELFAGGMPGDGSEVEASFRKLGERGQEDDQEAARLPPQFIHLKDAKIITASGSVPSRQGVLWRGTIASINGFNLGSLA